MSSVRRLVVFGDSFVSGYTIELGDNPNRSFAKHLGRLLGVEVRIVARHGASNLAIANSVVRYVANTSTASLNESAILVVWSDWYRTTRRDLYTNNQDPLCLVGVTWPESHKHYNDVINRAQTELSYLAIKQLLQMNNIPYRMINSYDYQTELDTRENFDPSGKKLHSSPWKMLPHRGDPNWIESDSLYNTLMDIVAGEWLAGERKLPVISNIIRLTRKKRRNELPLMEDCKHPTEQGHQVIAETLAPYIREIIKG